jgi:hypothetical protein
MNAFDHMVTILSAEAYKDNDFTPISKDEYAKFCKEYIFEKLKEIRFGTAFQKRFGVRDRVLSIFSEQKDAMDHIERYYIGESNEW